MTPAEELRAEAQRSENTARRLGAPFPERWDGSRPPPGSAEALAVHHEARARLFDRCAEAFEGLGQRVTVPAASDWLDAVVEEEREAQRVEGLRLKAMHERFAVEASERMAAWRREGRA